MRRDPTKMGREEKARAAARLKREGHSLEGVKQKLQFKDVIQAHAYAREGEELLQFDEGWDLYSDRRDCPTGDTRVDTKALLRRFKTLRTKLGQFQRTPEAKLARTLLDLLGCRYELSADITHTDQIASDKRYENGRTGHVVPPLSSLLRDGLERAVTRVTVADPTARIPKSDPRRHAWNSRKLHADIKAIADLAAEIPDADTAAACAAAKRLSAYVREAARPLRPKAGKARNHHPRQPRRRTSAALSLGNG